MHFRAAIEDMEPDHWVVWLLDLPGCHSSARTSPEALAAAPACVAQYFAWISSCDTSLTIPPQPYEVEVVESFQSFPSEQDPEYIVNAFFEDDKRLLGYWDIANARRLLDWSRAALLQVVQGLDEARLCKPIPGEVRESIGGILEHIAGAENWYLSKLGCALDRDRLQEDVFQKLAQVRLHSLEQMGRWIGDAVINENYGELWSARKVLRRTLWHERDHTQHIARLLAER